MKTATLPGRPALGSVRGATPVNSYLAATRHPWLCLLFVLPLLAVYEIGVLALGDGDPMNLRNGADVWLRWGLERYGIVQVWVPPAIVIGVLLLRTWVNWRERPRELFGTLSGMSFESGLYAIALWTVARNFEPLLRQWGLPLAEIRFATPATGQLVTYIGAGIYEEVLFGLGLFSVGCFLLRTLMLPGPIAVILAATAAAITFAAAHHIGPHGEELVPVRFLFRVLAGLFFTVIYVTRGFGIAAGAHAAYDILVGLAVG